MAIYICLQCNEGVSTSEKHVCKKESKYGNETKRIIEQKLFGK